MGIPLYERAKAFIQEKLDERKNQELSKLYDFCAGVVGRKVQFKLNGTVQLTLRHDAGQGIVLEGERLDLKTPGMIEVVCVESNGSVARTEQGDYRLYRALLSKME